MLAYIPRTSGIYQIRCMPTCKIYIGSAVDIRNRCAGHIRRLRSGNHGNRHLQSAWRKYGEEAFEFTVLELVERDILLQTEQRWIEQTHCTDSSIGFNIYTIAGSPGTTRVQDWVGFIAPDGTEVTITNLFEFCRQNNLDFPSMHRLAKGRSKLKSYKGWTHRNSPRKRAYIKSYDGFVSPDGESIGKITNLAEFCRERGLDNTHMIALIRGEICSHRGWTYAYGRKPKERKQYTGFVSPDGRLKIISNLTAFCAEHGLSPVHMHAVRRGTRKRHKGWTWRNSDERTAICG